MESYREKEVYTTPQITIIQFEITESITISGLDRGALLDENLLLP